MAARHETKDHEQISVRMAETDALKLCDILADTNIDLDVIVLSAFLLANYSIPRKSEVTCPFLRDAPGGFESAMNLLVCYVGPRRADDEVDVSVISFLGGFCRCGDVLVEPTKSFVNLGFQL